MITEIHLNALLLTAGIVIPGLMPATNIHKMKPQSSNRATRSILSNQVCAIWTEGKFTASAGICLKPGLRLHAGMLATLHVRIAQQGVIEEIWNSYLFQKVVRKNENNLTVFGIGALQPHSKSLENDHALLKLSKWQPLTGFSCKHDAHDVGQIIYLCLLIVLKGKN